MHKISKQIRVIFIGPDRVGKTEISKELSKNLNVPVYKSGREDDVFKQKDAQYNILKWGVYEQIKMIEVCNMSIIFDRFFPCEFVYSKVFKRNSDDKLIFDYDRWWNKLNGKIILLHKPTLSENDKFVNKEQYQKIKNLYLEYVSKTSCKNLVMDTSDRNLNVQVEKIKKFLGVRK